MSLSAVSITGRRFAGVAFAAAAAAAAALPASAAAQQSCPTTVDPAAFTSQAEIQKLVRKEMSYGLRFPGSESQKQELSWLEKQLKAIPGTTVRREAYKTPFWLPTPKAKKGPSLDIVKAGGLSVAGKGRKAKATRLPIASAIPFSKPTGNKGGKAGRLVYLKPGQAITRANAKGKVVIRDFEEGSIPYAGLQALGIYLSPDVAGKTGDFTRPYLTENLHSDLIDASKAGAAGVVMAFDVPRKQIEGYFDPHDGSFYRTPAVFVGHGEATKLKKLARAKRKASVTVRAKVTKRGTDHNVIATIPGTNPQKMVLNVNHDGAGWVQDNGVAGLIAVARYYGSLPAQCRERTLEVAFTANHTAVINDGIKPYSENLDKEYDQGKVSFAMSVEHLGTREIVPVKSGSGRKLTMPGNAEPSLWAVGPSDVMRSTIVGIAQARQLPSVAVLRGAAAPTATVPNICSFGGLGGIFHRRLIPSAGMISGPWTLYGPGSFGEKALDYAHMRKQLLAVGDTLLALDGVAQDQIAGTTYPQWRIDRANGAATCPDNDAPQYAPAS